MSIFNSIFIQFKDSLLYYEWLLGVYQLPLCLVTLALLWILVKIDFSRKVYCESIVLFDKLWTDIYALDMDIKKYIYPFLKCMRVKKPHSMISSEKNFEKMFKGFLSVVDRKKKNLSFKADLLFLYGALREKISLFSARSRVHRERRFLIRFRNIETVYYSALPENPLHQGLLINISGGGARLFTKEQVKKGQRIKLRFGRDAIHSISAKILEVIKKTDFYIVRVKFPLIYPTI
jgi:hypothetical protein